MKIYHVIIVFIVGLVLSACSGSGGAAPAAVTDTYTGLYAATGGEVGVASVNEDDEYTYFFNGVPVDVTLSGTLPISGFVDTTGGGIARHIGGTTYSYSRFGVVASFDNFTPGDTYTNGEVFYVGQKTSSMPVTGTAIYSGYLTTLQGGEFNDATVTFSVDYAGNTISGNTLDGISMIFDEGIIIGSDFSGTVSSGTTEIVGGYHGSFFGPNAEELGGVGTFDNGGGTFGYSFGAKK